MAQFKIPLNLPHAGTVASRIVYHLHRVSAPAAVLGEAQRLAQLLEPSRGEGENPAPEEAKRVAEESAALGRRLVDEIESGRLGDDRLGQSIRNLFECLDLGEEGASLSLRAGENPDSLLRPQ